MKKVKLFIVLLLLVIITPVLISAAPWIVIGLGSILQTNPATPEVRYGEFSFRLEYTVKGETKVIEDILICEYDGIGWNEGTGKYLKWKSHYASGANKLILLKFDNTTSLSLIKKDQIVKQQEVYYDPGFAGYYMGDESFVEGQGALFSDAAFYEVFENGDIVKGIVRSKDLNEKYDLTILSWTIEPPIVNNFN